MTQDVRLAAHGTPASDPAGRWDEHANAPKPGLIDGIAQYGKLGIPVSQLVLVLPWYGYTFPCTDNTRGAFCNISGNEVHGCPRSTCAQISFGNTQGLRASVNQSAIGPLKHDPLTMSVYFDWFNSTGARHQVWYDNPETLGDKFGWAGRTARLRGVGVFMTSMLKCEVSPEACQRAHRVLDPPLNESQGAMWAAFDRFGAKE
jgi:di-N-acetylchitobiase